jgi:hypothetical protein
VEAALAAQSVTTPKIGDGAVTQTKLANGSVQARHLADHAVNTAALADGAITHEKIAPLEIETEAIDNRAVTTDKVAEGAVSTPKLADSAVTTAKLANASVTNQKLGLGSVNTNEIASLAVTNPKMALKAIQVPNIDAQGSATSTVLMSTGSGNVSFNKISSSSFDSSLIQGGGVLGSLNGITLAPIGGLIFCMFQILSGSDSSLKWKGFNIRTASCVQQEETGEYLVTGTYRRRAPGHLICFIANNVYTPTFTETGFTYLTPHHSTASYVFLAYLPDGT